MKAKAAVFMGAKKPFEVREFDVVAPPKGYGRCRLIASGVCGTDLHIWRGLLDAPAPSIIGHEFVGRLDALNPASGETYGLKAGDAVIADIAAPCGECKLCRAGDDANCVRMGVTNGGDIGKPPYLYGGYAEVNFTPLANLIKIPDGLDPVAVSVFACPGPTAMHAFALARKAGIELDTVESAVVQGLGPVGLYSLLYLKALGIRRVFAITSGRNEARERIAHEFGAERVFALSSQAAEEINAEILRETGGLGVDLAIEASGAPSAFAEGLDLLRNRGVYLVPGQYSSSGTVAIHPESITFKALHIIGSSQYSFGDVRAYLAFLEAHPELLGKILALAAKYKVEEVNAAFSDMEKRRNIKTVLVP